MTNPALAGPAPPVAPYVPVAAYPLEDSAFALTFPPFAGILDIAGTFSAGAFGPAAGAPESLELFLSSRSWANF